jgi:arylsulfatase A-like enzyme
VSHPDSNNRSSLPSYVLPEHGGPAMDVGRQPVSMMNKPGLEAPAKAPNVMIVLLDDMGFGGPSPFGGPCEMATAERLSTDGLRFSRFHVNAMCSPTRQSLMTGRNSHAVGMGAITEFATSAPGYTAVRPESAATIAQILRGNGYSTAAFGKMHQTPQWEVSAVGPFDRWPTGEGFERFYGFVGPEMNHWDPLLYDGTTPVEPNPDHSPDYHLSEDLAEQAISWLQTQNSLAPDKPFFMYLAMGACHTPLHVPPVWRDKYRGKFAHGWDEQREITLARQKELGVVPPETELSPWAEGLPRWADLTTEAREVAEAFMETYAAVAEHVDAQIGRVVDSLEQSGQLDNTLIFYILGDNGASAEGGINGSLNIDRCYSGITDSVEYLREHLDDLGGPHSYPAHPAGWSIAMSTPYQWTKQVASHFGGTRDGMVVHWPAGIVAKGEVRHQWHHVIDVLPTILDVTGIPAPVTHNGIAQQRMDGTSLAYTFDDANASDRRITQYFEMIGNRAMYHDGWIASVKHRTPWEMADTELPDFETEKWQLYNLTADWSQARDVADENPEILERLKRLFLVEAARNNVFPLDDRSGERMNADIAPRPDLPGNRTEMTFQSGMTRMYEDAVLNVKNRSHRVIAAVELGPDTGNGVIIAQGGRFGGWTLHMVDQRPVYTYNYFGLDCTDVEAREPLGPGGHKIEMHFDYEGGGLGAGGTVRLIANGDVVGEGKVERTAPYLFSSHETLDIGVDLGTPVAPIYDQRSSRFDAEIVEVRVSTQKQHVTDRPGQISRLWAHQ